MLHIQITKESSHIKIKMLLLDEATALSLLHSQLRSLSEDRLIDRERDILASFPRISGEWNNYSPQLTQKSDSKSRNLEISKSRNLEISKSRLDRYSRTTSPVYHRSTGCPIPLEVH